MFSMPANANSAVRSVSIAPLQEDKPSRLLEGELLDLYGAILIVVPVAFFFKSLWF
jgi:hypothetical protein